MEGSRTDGSAGSGGASRRAVSVGRLVKGQSFGEGTIEVNATYYYTVVAGRDGVELGSLPRVNIIKFPNSSFRNHLLERVELIKQQVQSMHDCFVGGDCGRWWGFALRRRTTE